MNYTPFHGMLVNTHNQLLPVAQLRSVGVTGVRSDVAPGMVNEAAVRAFLAHYDMPTIWMLSQMERDPLPGTRKLYRAGIRDLEPQNEPEGSWNEFVMTPEQVADRIISIKKAYPQMRLYGPSCSTWNIEYIDRFIKRLGPNYKEILTCITWHGYWSKIGDLAEQYLYCMTRWGLPGNITEVAFAPLPGWIDYPVTVGQSEGIRQTKVELGHLPWTLYDGPESRPGIGLFEKSSGQWMPTTLYGAISDTKTGGIKPIPPAPATL